MCKDYSVRGVAIAYFFVHLSSLLFVLASHQCLLFLLKDRFIAAFCRAISAAGLPQASAYRDHSFCWGAASWAFNCRVSGELIQIYGDWASDTYKVCLEVSVKSKLAFAQQLHFAVLSGTSLLFFAQFVFGHSVWWQRGLLGISLAMFTFRSQTAATDFTNQTAASEFTNQPGLQVSYFL